MPDYTYRIVNVFADPEAPGKLTGNPLCVFEPIGRPARLRLDVDREQRIFVGGRVVELARGTLTLQD